MDPALSTEIAALSRMRALERVIEPGSSTIQQFYANSTCFVTGGSGFLGKALLEKLIRSTNLKKIFVLIRPKKGKNINERLEAIFEDPIFDDVKIKQPGFIGKIYPVEGDVAELRLGIKDEDWKAMTEEVDVIFHLAATTRFDEPLQVATMINVRGTRELVTLAKGCGKLRSFVHVSTAYAQATKDRSGKEVLEFIYRPPIPGDALIQMAENVETQRINDLTNGLIKGWPNTYTFTKAVAEDLVKTMGADLPVCIVRPAIVVHAYREPLPGWLDVSNIYGASGIVLGPGMGVVQVIYASDDHKLGLIPVDYVTNSTIAAGWEVGQRIVTNERAMKIYHVISSTRNHCLCESAISVLKRHAKSFPFPDAVWWSLGYNTRYKFIFYLVTWLLHYIPAYVIDGICLLMGQKRRFVKIYEKAYKLNVALGYFMTQDWHFEDKNLEELFDRMSPVDKIIYNFDIKDLDWDEYLKYWAIGIRRYIVKDGLKNTEYAKKKMIVFHTATYIIMPIYLFCLAKIFISILATIGICVRLLITTLLI